jgi:signal peptidase I
MKKILSVFWEFIQVIAISLIIIIPVRYYIVQPFFVKGASMENSFRDGDYLIIDELSYRLRTPKRGEVVVFRYPNDPSQFYIKRIIGLPGETVEVADGQIYIKNSEHPEGFVLNENDYLGTGTTPGNIIKTLDIKNYFVMGDNRFHSYDSRGWGELDRKFMIGKVLFRVWPMKQAMAFSLPEYGITGN